MAFFAEASSSTGVGHLIRCMALAEQAARQGLRVSFHLREDGVPWASQQVLSRGWRLTTHDWHLDYLLDISGANDLTVVDSYRLTGDEITQMHSAAGLLVVIDDLGDRRLRADVIVNQNVLDDQPRYQSANTRATLLLGPRYAMLRGQFRSCREAAGPWRRLERSSGSKPERVLVLLGGTDVAGLAPSVAQAVVLGLPEAAVRVVARHGSQPDGRRVLNSQGQIEILDPTSAIERHMMWADLVVSAAGTTLWELCCLGRATAALVVADNQRATYDALAARGAILPLGTSDDFTEELVAGELNRLDANRIAALAETAATITDGRGAERVVEVLLQRAMEAR